MKLHQTISTARKNKGFTQEELAELSHITVRTIQRIEAGETIPRNYTLKAIATALDMPFEAFTNELEKEQNVSADVETDAIHTQNK